MRIQILCTIDYIEKEGIVQPIPIALGITFFHKAQLPQSHIIQIVFRPVKVKHHSQHLHISLTISTRKGNHRGMMCKFLRVLALFPVIPGPDRGSLL